MMQIIRCLDSFESSDNTRERYQPSSATEPSFSERLSITRYPLGPRQPASQ